MEKLGPSSTDSGRRDRAGTPWLLEPCNIGHVFVHALRKSLCSCSFGDGVDSAAASET